MEPTPPTIPPPEPLPAASPFRPEPEHPRLGILHLMVLTTCVAVYFSVLSPFPTDVNTMEHVAALVVWLGFGISSGAALAGLLLWPARRYRGLPFPTQPGERLLILLGVGALLEMLRELSLLPIIHGGDFDSPFVILRGICQLLLVVVLGVLYLVAIVRTKILRWRLYFIVGFLLDFLTPHWAGLLWSPAWPGFLVIWACYPAVGPVFLLGVILRDVVQKVRYRWPHWLGVAIPLWNAAITMVWVLSWIL